MNSCVTLEGFHSALGRDTPDRAHLPLLWLIVVAQHCVSSSICDEKAGSAGRGSMVRPAVWCLTNHSGSIDQIDSSA